MATQITGAAPRRTCGGVGALEAHHHAAVSHTGGVQSVTNQHGAGDTCPGVLSQDRLALGLLHALRVVLSKLLVRPL